MKNREYGLLLHDSGHTSLVNSLLAENAYNIEMRWSDDVEIRDTEIRGVSSHTRYLVHPPYYNRPCTSRILSPIGYQIQTTIHNWIDGKNKGALLWNEHFSLFDHDDECSDSVPITFDTANIQSGHWDYISTFQNVTIVRNQIMDALAASDGGIPDIVIIDPDGWSDPLSQASGPASFVINKPYLIDFIRGECHAHHEGILYCDNTCLRTITFVVDQELSKDYDFKVVMVQNSVEVNVPDIYLYNNDAYLKTHEQNQ